MKKLIALLLALLMVFTLVGCSSDEGDKTTGDADVKIGAIILGDENEGYSYAHIAGIKAAAEKLGILNLTLFGSITLRKIKAVMMLLLTALKMVHL